jgi:hypothetical protein
MLVEPGITCAFIWKFPNKDHNTICLTIVITLSDFDVQEFKISSTD